MKINYLLAFALAFSTLSIAAQNPSVAGIWKVTGEVQGYNVDQSCTFAQDSKKLTGTCTSAEQSKVEITGDVDGNKVNWKYNSEYNGEKLAITYTGTLEGAEMKGTIDVQPFGVGGSFMAKKDAAK